MEPAHESCRNQCWYIGHLRRGGSMLSVGQHPQPPTERAAYRCISGVPAAHRETGYRYRVYAGGYGSVGNADSGSLTNVPNLVACNPLA